MTNFKSSLLEQFKNSQGIKSDDLESKIIMLDFANWILERKQIGDNYTELLKELEIPYETEECAEIGKSAFDSVILPYDTKIITPHIEGLETINPNRVINSIFQVIEGIPVIYMPTRKEITEMIEMPESMIRRYMTQNPYQVETINNWHRLHNAHDLDITVGLFGSIYDKDIEKKIKDLKNLKEKLERDYIESYEEYNGEYYYVLASPRKVKKLEKVLTR